jgi:hypothetical protein
MARPPRTSRPRSAVSSGAVPFLEGADGRSATGRLFKDLLDEAVAERGGREAMTVVQWQAARAWAALSVEMHRIEAEATASGRPLPDGYGVLSDRASRQVSRMGPVKPQAQRQTLQQRHQAARQKGSR